MECMKCGHENEPDAKFCRQCGSKIAVPTTKDQVEFVPTKRRATDRDLLCFGEEQETTPGIVLGVVFIIISLIIAVAIFWPMIFSDFGTTIGNLAGGFGETMGNLGSDFGNFMGNWADSFGNAVGNFFEGIFTEDIWWDVLRVLIVGAFLIVGIVLIVVNMRKR
ncbi:MAG: zinc-ribbon domain-containing protein [Candidatus Hodarchaeota archaeon]